MNIDFDKKIDITCVGILVLDIFGKSIDEFPKKGTSKYFDNLDILPGGCAYNTGVDCARLSMNTAIIGKVGNDPFGDIVIDNIKSEGVDVNNIAVDKTNSTSFSFVMVPEDGARRIYHTFGANKSFSLDDINKEIIKNTKILHIAGASLMPSFDGEPTVKLLKYAKENGVITSMDPVVKEGIQDLILPCLPYLDVFLPNNDESEFITGLKNPYDQLKFYKERTDGYVGIKLGEDGCIIHNGERIVKYGTYPLEVVDTCGAGDAFIAGFLYGLVNKMDISECVKYATATARYCIISVGAVSDIKNKEQIIEFVKNNDLEEKIENAHNN